ncbi:hypothetical protein FACS189472_07780 [Alphaproteobacteria bacterium]|nr:hypothetical protein FACS189472_07780 [Alphaproteobacteria bacterium]
MVGQYSKNNLLIRSLRHKYPYDVDLTLKKPKIVYNISTLALSPNAIKSFLTDTPKARSDVNWDRANDSITKIKDVNSDINSAASVVSKASTAVDMAKKIGIGVPSSVSSLATTASEIGNAAGSVLGAVGAAASGVGLAFDIANAKKEGKVTFDNAMKMADDGTGIVAGIASMFPGPGTAIGAGLNIGEKIVTGGFKAAHAVKEEEKREGVKHLKPGVWMSTVLGEFAPKWWTLNVGSKEWKQYWKDDKAKKKAEAAEKKKEKAKQKAERKEIWKHGTAKEKAMDFFFG